MRAIMTLAALFTSVTVVGCGAGATCMSNCADGSAPETPGDGSPDQAVDAATDGSAVDLRPETPLADAMDAGCAADAHFECAEHGIGHFCSDTSVPAMCVAGKWACGPFSVPLSECRCTGPLGNGCSYTPECVLICADGGLDTRSDAGPDGNPGA